MATERPKIQGYVLPDLHKRFTQWKDERGIAKDSEALNKLLAEFFGVNYSDSPMIHSAAAISDERVKEIVYAAQAALVERINKIEAAIALQAEAIASFTVAQSTGESDNESLKESRLGAASESHNDKVRELPIIAALENQIRAASELSPDELNESLEHAATTPLEFVLNEPNSKSPDESPTLTPENQVESSSEVFADSLNELLGDGPEMASAEEETEQQVVTIQASNSINESLAESQAVTSEPPASELLFDSLDKLPNSDSKGKSELDYESLNESPTTAETTVEVLDSEPKNESLVPPGNLKKTSHKSSSKSPNESPDREQLAELLGVSYDSIRRWEASGELALKGWEPIPSTKRPVRYRPTKSATLKRSATLRSAAQQGWND